MDFIFLHSGRNHENVSRRKKTGTLEILLTKAVNPRQLILGKYLACLMLIMIALAFTLPYYISVARIGDIDHGATLSGYLGLILMSSAYIAIGLFASSITNNQIVAFLLALLIGIVFHFILDVISSGMRGWAGNLLSDLSVGKHFDSMSRGVIDTKDILFFAGLTLLGLFLSETFISKNK
ncbi:MAG: ABC transporter permease subunit [Saprospiraceae bacterium]